MGLGAQIAEPTLLMFAVVAGGVVVVGGGGGGGGGVLDDELDDVRVLDWDVTVVDLSKVVVLKVGLFVTALGAGTLIT